MPSLPCLRFNIVRILNDLRQPIHYNSISTFTILALPQTLGLTPGQTPGLSYSKLHPRYFSSPPKTRAKLDSHFFTFPYTSPMVGMWGGAVSIVPISPRSSTHSTIVKPRTQYHAHLLLHPSSLTLLLITAFTTHQNPIYIYHLYSCNTPVIIPSPLPYTNHTLTPVITVCIAIVRCITCIQVIDELGKTVIEFIAVNVFQFVHGTGEM